MNINGDAWNGIPERIELFNTLMIKDFVIKDYRNMAEFIEYVVETKRNATELEIALSCSMNGHIPFGAKVKKIEDNTYKVIHHKGY